MANYLKNLRIKSIGSVDRPCNQAATVALMKRAELQGGDDGVEIAKAIFEYLFSGSGSTLQIFKRKEDIRVNFDEILKKLPESIQKSLTDDQKEAIKKALTPEVLESIAKIFTDAEKLPDVQKALKTAEEKNTSLQSDIDELKKNAPKPEEDIYKGLPEAIVKQLKDNATQIAKMESDIKKRDFVAKIPVFKSLPIQQDTFGDLLFKIAEAAGDDAYKDLSAVLKAADEGMSKAGIFTEIGSNNNDTSNDGVEKRAEDMAQEIRKRQPELTIEQALDKVWTENPNMWKEYMSERGGN